jgi:hypothetical protein
MTQPDVATVLVLVKQCQSFPNWEQCSLVSYKQTDDAKM